MHFFTSALSTKILRLKCDKSKTIKIFRFQSNGILDFMKHLEKPEIRNISL